MQTSTCQESLWFTDSVGCRAAILAISEQQFRNRAEGQEVRHDAWHDHGRAEHERQYGRPISLDVKLLEH